MWRARKKGRKEETGKQENMDVNLQKGTVQKKMKWKKSSVVITIWGHKPLRTPAGESFLMESPIGRRDTELQQGPHIMSTQGSQRSPNKTILPSIPVHAPM